MPLLSMRERYLGKVEDACWRKFKLPVSTFGPRVLYERPAESESKPKFAVDNTNTVLYSLSYFPLTLTELLLRWLMRSPQPLPAHETACVFNPMRIL
jgi:hypothetical protein